MGAKKPSGDSRVQPFEYSQTSQSRDSPNLLAPSVLLTHRISDMMTCSWSYTTSYQAIVLQQWSNQNEARAGAEDAGLAPGGKRLSNACRENMP